MQIKNAEKALKRKIFLSYVPEKRLGEVQRKNVTLETLINW